MHREARKVSKCLIDNLNRTHERWQMLPAIRLSSSSAILQNEADLNDSRSTSSHQAVPKNGVHHRAKHQLLWMGTHSPTSENDDQSWQNIATRPSSSTSAKPNTQQTSTPPNDPHGRMLQVIPDPRSTPPMLRERIHTSPKRDDH